MLIHSIDSSVPVNPSTASAVEGVAVLGTAQAGGGQVASAKPEPAPQAAPTADQVAQAVKQANQSVQAVATNLEFAIDPDSQTVVVKLLDTATHEVIRQFPTPEMLRIAQSLDQMQGLLLSTQA